jgi:hypothetical protein
MSAAVGAAGSPPPSTSTSKASRRRLSATSAGAGAPSVTMQTPSDIAGTIAAQCGETLTPP